MFIKPRYAYHCQGLVREHGPSVEELEKYTLTAENINQPLPDTQGKPYMFCFFFITCML